jgi:hypothetical protein
MKPAHERREVFVAERSVEEVLTRISDSLKASGYKPRRKDGKIFVSTGSNTLLRLFRTMLPTGRTNVPAGMTVSATPEGDDTSVEVHAYDKLGPDIDAAYNPVLREKSEENIRLLIQQAKAALQT